MNRRNFFKALPTLAVAPLVPAPKPTPLIPGQITIWDGKNHIVIGTQVNEKEILSWD